MNKKKKAPAAKKKTKSTTGTHLRHVARKKKRVVSSRSPNESGSEFSSIMKALQTKTQPIQKNKPANVYVATVSFSTDRRLAQREVDALAFAIAVQVEDPSGLDGDKRAEFSTSDVKTTIKRTREIVRRRK